MIFLKVAKKKMVKSGNCYCPAYVHKKLRIFKKGSKMRAKSSHCYSAAYRRDSWRQVFYNLGSGSWLAWANDTAVHYAAVHCLSTLSTLLSNWIRIAASRQNAHSTNQLH